MPAAAIAISWGSIPTRTCHDPDARLLFRDQAGTTWVDSHGAPTSPARRRRTARLRYAVC